MLMNDLLGSRWRDSNGHEFVLERLTPEAELSRDGETVHGMYGPTTGCQEDICGTWWHRVHTNDQNEFEEYANQARGWGTEEDIRSGRVYGWERVGD